MQIAFPSAAAAAAQARAAQPLFAGSAADPNAPAKAPSADDAAVSDFMAYAKMTPAQQMRAALLGKMGMSEEDLAKMDPKERKKIEDQIAQMIKQQIEQGDQDHKGVLADIMV
jgi:hypothetical protein